MNYEGKQVLVLGLGESGLAMAHWLARGGAQLVVADTRAEPPGLPDLLAAVPSARFVAGAFGAALLQGIDFVAVSPGLSPADELAEIVPAARENGVPLWSEIELFSQALQQLGSDRQYQPKVIAITGTNGKTTVTRLTGLLCQRAGLTVQVAGNISPAALDVLRAALDNDQLPEVWVLELSSFQLHFTFSLQAHVATVLNVSQDHLDWHGDMEAYVADKARIFGAGTVRLLNRDDPYSSAMSTPLASVISFGADAPDESGCFGLVNENGMQWLTLAFSEDDVQPAPEGQARQPDKRRRKKDVEAAPLLLKRLMPADALKIRGQHNALNALAALALCRSIGLPLAPLLHGLRDYHGEPHRVELVATVADVQYYDDSKGTNVGATVAALKGMGAEIANDGRRLVLIAGGDGKGQDFSPLLPPVARYVRAVLLIGRDAPAIGSALADANVPLHDCASLENAVQQAADLAQPGDVVLMSPACASFDMFRNYLHRAQTFIDAVRELGLARGEVSA